LQRSYSLIPHIISSISKQEKLDIKSPWTKNDFIFVSDVADALEMISEKCDKSNIYNVGSGKSISVNDIVKNVCDRFDYPYELNHDKIPDENIDFWADISRIKQDIKWKPKIQINEGIDETIKHYDNLSKNKQIIIR
jgi:nucleoside-diphosphate-sugar epimerase